MLPIGTSAVTVGLGMLITFDTAPVPGTYGIALGDVDAEEIIITATGPDGAPVSTHEWLGTTFNYAGGTGSSSGTLNIASSATIALPRPITYTRPSTATGLK